MAKKLIPTLASAIILIFLLQVVFAAPPVVILISPADGNISSANNVTFVCNASDDGNVYNVSLFTDINGSFAAYSTKRIMELDKSSDTMLICRFSNYTCEDGEAGENSSTEIVQSRFMKGVLVNESGSLKYPTSGNINYTRGTLEFWISPRYNTSGLTENTYLLSTDGSGESVGNRMEIYIDKSGDNPALCFILYDNSNDPAYTETFCTVNEPENHIDWHEGEWHHIAVLWDLDSNDGDNNVSVNMFLNGSNSSMTWPDDNFNERGASFGPHLYIGSSDAGSAQKSAVFDELRITNRLLSEEEMQDSYLRGAADHRNESVNWAINLSDGAYKWACLAYDNESGGNWSSNQTFYVDATSPPVLNNITLSPSSEDDIDPGMNLSVTANVTDYSNVSHVTFQWRKTINWDTPPVYNNTMDYNNVTGLYENATIIIDQTGGAYYYRIWSNDTLNHSGNSSTYNITASWDYTWNSTPSDFGTVYGFIGCLDCYIGTLIINNTGDDTLSFNLANDWPLGISYNESNPLSVSPKNATHINVTAKFSSNESEYNIIINVTASHGSGNPSPSSKTATATLISYSGGPYFDNDDLVIVLYPTSAYHSTSYNLSAKLKNIGNESATNVWINWTLPAGWNNTSGNLSQYIGDLNGTTSGGNIAWNNITVYIPPEASPAGVQNLSVAVSSDNNCSANKSLEVYVLCNNDDSVCGNGCSYVTDNDCSIPQSPGGGATITSIAGFPKEYKIELVLPSRLDINRGESKILRVGVNNTVPGTKLKNVYLLLSGYMQTFMNFSPAYIGEIGYGETKYFEVEIRAPLYLIYNEYNLNITTGGYFFEASKNTSAEKTAKLLLVTHKFIENKTLEYYEAAKEALLEMENAGLEERQLDELLKEIEKALDEGNYEKVKELSEQLMQTKDLAFDLNTKIGSLGNDIENIKSQNVNLPETEKMLFLSKAAFQRGDYQRANERIESALLVYTLEAGTAGYLIIIYNYWWLIVIAILIASLGLRKTQKLMYVSTLRSRLKSLDAEEGMIKKLILELQEEYAKGKGGAEKFRQMLQSYENGLANTGKKRVDILSKLKDALGSGKATGLLKDEEKRIRNIIADAQKEYFLHGKIGKDYYNRFMENAKNQLFGIQNLLDNSMTRGGKEKTAASAAKKAMMLFLLIIFAAGAVSAAEKDDALGAMQRAEAIIAEMQAMGFGVTYANDTLSEAKKLYESGFYDGAESLAEKVSAIKEKALETDGLINRVETRVYELSSLGYDTSSVQDIFNSGVSEFNLDNYVDAEKIMLQALDELDELESEESLKRIQQSNPVSEILLDYLWLFPIVFLVLLVAGFRLKDVAKRKGRRTQIKVLEAEKERIKKAVADAQMNYFHKGSVGKMDYELLIKRYNSRLSDINRRISVLSEKPKNH